jgi:hypothetical protein
LPCALASVSVVSVPENERLVQCVGRALRRRRRRRRFHLLLVGSFKSRVRRLAVWTSGRPASPPASPPASRPSGLLLLSSRGATSTSTSISLSPGATPVARPSVVQVCWRVSTKSSRARFHRFAHTSRWKPTNKKRHSAALWRPSKLALVRGERASSRRQPN